LSIGPVELDVLPAQGVAEDYTPIAIIQQLGCVVTAKKLAARSLEVERTGLVPSHLIGQSHW